MLLANILDGCKILSYIGKLQGGQYACCSVNKWKYLAIITRKVSHYSNHLAVEKPNGTDPIQLDPTRLYATKQSRLPSVQDQATAVTVIQRHV
jgi:hypothetical protein